MYLFIFYLEYGEFVELRDMVVPSRGDLNFFLYIYVCVSSSSSSSSSVCFCTTVNRCLDIFMFIIV